MKIVQTSEQVLLFVKTMHFRILGANNDKLAEEVLASTDRMSINKDIPLYEDTVFAPKEGSEGARLLDAIDALAKENGLKVANIWSQIHRPLESTSLHNHNPYAMAFVYYVKVPEGSGNLSFSFNEANVLSVVTPEEGTLLVFPAWCYHKVAKNTGSGTRISIAGNLEVIK